MVYQEALQGDFSQPCRLQGTRRNVSDFNLWELR